MFPCSRAYGLQWKDQQAEPFVRLANEFTLTKLLLIICKILSGRGVAVGEAAVVVLVSVFAQSYLFASKTKVRTLANILVDTRDVRWSKFAGTGKERNVFPFKKDLSLSRFFSFFLFPTTGLSSLSYLSWD